jgi:hypothetical protein
MEGLGAAPAEVERPKSMPTGPTDMSAADINLKENSDAFAEYAAKIAPLQESVIAAKEQYMAKEDELEKKFEEGTLSLKEYQKARVENEESFRDKTRDNRQ